MKIERIKEIEKIGISKFVDKTREEICELYIHNTWKRDYWLGHLYHKGWDYVMTTKYHRIDVLRKVREYENNLKCLRENMTESELKECDKLIPGLCPNWVLLDCDLEFTLVGVEFEKGENFKELKVTMKGVGGTLTNDERYTSFLEGYRIQRKVLRIYEEKQEKEEDNYDDIIEEVKLSLERIRRIIRWQNVVREFYIQDRERECVMGY